MSANSEAFHAEGHDHHGHDGGSSHGTFGSYVTGFVLSVILTAIPFWLVMGHVFENTLITAFLVMGFGFVQILVHMVYFLHMNTHSEGGWNFMALIFTAVLVLIMLTGSLWVMYHLNTNMMPHMLTPEQAETLP